MVRYESILNQLTKSAANDGTVLNFNIYKPLAGQNFRENGQGGNFVLRYYLPNGNKAAITLPARAGTRTSTHKLAGGGLVAINAGTTYQQILINLINRMYQFDIRGAFTIDYEIFMQRKQIFIPVGINSFRPTTIQGYFDFLTTAATITRIDATSVRVDIVSNHPNNNPIFYVSGIKGQGQSSEPTQDRILYSGSKSIILPYESSETTAKILYQVIGSFQGVPIESDTITIAQPDTPIVIPPTDPPDTTPTQSEVTIGIQLGQYDLAGLRFTANIHPRLPTDDNLTVNVFRKYETETSFIQVATHQNPAQTRQYIIAFNANIQGQIYITLKSGDTILATSNTIPLRTEGGLIVTESDTNILNLLNKMPVQFVNVADTSMKVRIQSDLLLLDDVLFATVFFTSGENTIRGTSQITNQYDYVELGVSGLDPSTLYTVRIVIRYKGSNHDSHLLSFRTLPSMPDNPTPAQLQERTLDKLMISKLTQDDANLILDLSLTQKELIAAGLFEAQSLSTGEDLAADQNRKNKRTRYGQVQGDSAFSKQSQDLIIADFASDIEDLPSPNEDDSGDYEI